MTKKMMVAGILGVLSRTGPTRSPREMKAFNGWPDSVRIGWELTDLVRQGVIRRVRWGQYLLV
jgi:hypothetical protein